MSTDQPASTPDTSALPNPHPQSRAGNAAREVPSAPAGPLPRVGVIMGSVSDWDTMQHTAAHLEALGIPYEKRIVSAHRTPDLLFSYGREAAGRGIRVIIAGAGGAAHLPGMVASLTELPVLGVPVMSQALHGVDSLLSIVQMPAGVPVATFAIGKAGAVNAALTAAAILALDDADLRLRLNTFRSAQTQRVMDTQVPR